VKVVVEAGLFFSLIWIVEKRSRFSMVYMYSRSSDPPKMKLETD
jgi:hypothetical protein